MIGSKDHIKVIVSRQWFGSINRVEILCDGMIGDREYACMWMSDAVVFFRNAKHFLAIDLNEINNDLYERMY